VLFDIMNSRELGVPGWEEQWTFDRTWYR